MLDAGALNSAFQIYWDELARCRNSRAYWALLHVTVCLPDICAALQSGDGETKGALYKAWCERYLPDQLLTDAEWWAMRCKVLHQGRAAIGGSTRYAGFSFAQPATTGEVLHRRLEGTTLVLDVGELSSEMRAGVDRWINALEGNRSGPEANNAARNLASLVCVRQFALPGPLGTSAGVPSIINITRSS